MQRSFCVAEIRETWSWRELPILREALRRIDSGEQLPELENIRQATGLSVSDTWAAVQALKSADPPYLEVLLSGGWSNQASGNIEAVTERTRRELGSWPSAETLVDRLAEALSAAAAAEAEPARKGKLQAAAEALTSFARDVAVQTIGTRLGAL